MDISFPVNPLCHSLYVSPVEGHNTPLYQGSREKLYNVYEFVYLFAIPPPLPPPGIHWLYLFVH